MSKSKEIIVSYLISLIFGVIIYYFSLDLIISGCLAFSMFILIKFYLINKIKKNNNFKKSLSNFSHLANSLIMQLTVTPNVNSSLNEISSFLDEKENIILQNDELLIKEKLDSIENNYDFPLYQVFKEIIVLYDTQGGNIIDMSMRLLEQIDNYIKNIEEISLDNYKKIGEVLVLWGFSFAALFYVKHVLHNYYIEIVKENIFKIVIFLFFFMFVTSLFILTKKYIEVKIDE